MRPFEFAAPDSLDEAFEILSKANGEVRPLAGGTDLIDQLRLGLRGASLVMDVKNIPELMRLEYSQDGLHIGAGVSCTDVRQFGPVGERYNALAESCGLIGYVQIQNRASIGGNICNASPAADSVPSLLIYEAKAVIVGPGGRREMSLEDFFVGPGETVLERDEILMEVVLPPPPPDSVSHYLRFITGQNLDISVAGVGSLIALERGEGVCQKARIALSAVSPRPTRARDAEAVLEGRVIDEVLIREAGKKAVNHCDPITDLRGTIEYRKELIEVLTRSVVTKCLGSLGVSV